MIDTTTVLITTAASYRICVRTSTRGRGVENLGKVQSTLPRPPPLLATHFARLRSRYRLIDDYNNDRLLYIHRASLPLPLPLPSPSVQSASKQIGSNGRTPIIPISYYHTKNIRNIRFEFFIYPFVYEPSRLNPRLPIHH